MKKQEKMLIDTLNISRERAIQRGQNTESERKNIIPPLSKQKKGENTLCIKGGF